LEKTDSIALFLNHIVAMFYKGRVKMLGELIYEATSKVVGIRMLDENGTSERTFQQGGMIFGIECHTTLTLVGKFELNGVQYLEGYGILLTKDGDTATFTVSGINIPKGLPPLASSRGATFFRTQSQKLISLNRVVCIYEAEVNEDSSYEVKAWEWK
jgi:hypothetical protein